MAGEEHVTDDSDPRPERRTAGDRRRDGALAVGLRPMRKRDLEEVLGWTRDKKPSGYSLPDVFTDDGALDAVEQEYEDHFRTNPLF
jgi:hypothetical protein